MASPWLSIVIPAYNEARRLPRALARIRDWAAGQPRPVELIVVDDGSTDETAAIADAAAPLPARLLRLPDNRGKGAALRAGVAAATGELVLLCDADLSADMDQLPRLLAELERGADIAIGSRDLPESRLDPPQRWGRRLAAWAFRAVRRRLMLPAIRDTQCGFKLFCAAAAREVFAACREDGWLIDCEALALAESAGRRIAEVGIVWRDDRDSRVRPLRDSWGTLGALVRLARRMRAARPSAPRE